jgi:predicted GIY-YIG superfamily endonuclease
MSALLEAAKHAPHEPGVYAFLGPERELLYVGKAADLRRRLGDHARDQSRTRDLRRSVLLHTVRSVQWEEHPDEESAWEREADLIVMLKPPFNASHADQARDHYIVVTPGAGLVSFALASTISGAGRTYGTFPHLAKGGFSHIAKGTKAGYTALLRLVWVAGTPDPAAFLPTRIGGASPPTGLEAPVAAELRAPLHDFLSGRSARLLPALWAAAGAADIPVFTRAALERDLDAAGEFFELGPRRVRRLRLRHELAPGPVEGAVMAELLAQELRETIGDFHLSPPVWVTG